MQTGVPENRVSAVGSVGSTGNGIQQPQLNPAFGVHSTGHLGQHGEAALDMRSGCASEQGVCSLRLTVSWTVVGLVLFDEAVDEP